MVYVAFSRVTSLSGLYIVEKLVIPPFKKSSALEEIERMKASRQMELSYANKINGNLRMIYQNVNSLPNKLKLIECDKWYLQSHILIFVETYTQEKHNNLNIPVYTVAYRHDAISNLSGIICYFQNEFYKKYANVSITTSVESGGKENSKFHIFLLHFKIGCINIVTGYKSPRTSFNIFKKHLEIVMGKCGSLKDEKFILLGDFNFDTMSSQSPLEQYLNIQFGFSKALQEQVTTSNNTQIDVIFVKKISNFHADVYQTYFSDHMPIFIGISHEKNLKKSQLEDDQNKCVSRKRKVNDPIAIKNKIRKLASSNDNNTSNVDQIIDLDTYHNPNMVVRSNEEILVELMNKVKREIQTRGVCLTDGAMNHIGELINSNHPEYKFQNTVTLNLQTK